MNIYKPVFLNPFMQNEKGQFMKGFPSWNKGIQKKLDIEEINKQHWENGKSIIDISKELGVSDRLIRIRMKENNFNIRSKTKPSNEIKLKISNTLKQKGIQPIQRFSGEVWNKGLNQKDPRVKNNIRGLLENRKTQILPLQDTSIEIKIQNFLKQLGIQFETHKLISEIRHAYQCDIFIPVQDKINKKIILECDGCYWHGCLICNKELNKKQKNQICKDNKRRKELTGKGYKVIRLKEHEINNLNLEQFKSIFDI